ncbi:MAG: helix-turn-helix domain-containing protein [Prevotella sp.]
MKDRIRKVMESQHMTQQIFAEYIQIAPATLSSIFTGRTRPTLAVVEAIKNKIPSISTDWLMFGNGEMFAVNDTEKSQSASSNVSDMSAGAMLNFEDTIPQPIAQTAVRNPNFFDNPEQRIIVKNLDKPQRKITEIRIFYDDQTWETFVSKK